jgi:hypothetical protein
MLMHLENAFLRLTIAVVDKPILVSLVALLLGFESAVWPADSDQRVLDSERRALEAEGRAVAAERRALEAERRALEIERRGIEADRNASGGAGGAPSVVQPETCQAATSRYERICSAPSRDTIGDAPDCATAQAEMRLRCGG